MEDRKYLGFTFQNDSGGTEYFHWVALPYGLHPGAYWIDMTAKCLKIMYVKNGAAQSTLYYLDDLITIVDLQNVLSAQFGYNTRNM